MKDIIITKISYQFKIFKRKDRVNFYKEKIIKLSKKEDIFIIEAQAAKEYWFSFNRLISTKVDWYGRNPHNHDPVNQLLDIGYHYLTNEVSKIFDEIDLPYELGLLHKAQSKKSKPLVYDFIEWLRPIMVDRVLLVYLKKKKLRYKKIK
jgi:CRISPR-associated endonuclease Cas1